MAVILHQRKEMLPRFKFCFLQIHIFYIFEYLKKGGMKTELLICKWRFWDDFFGCINDLFSTINNLKRQNKKEIWTPFHQTFLFTT
jgi:hypothetical protein